jgi:hypothetical protein
MWHQNQVTLTYTYFYYTHVTGIISKHFHNTAQYVECTAANVSGKDRAYVLQTGTAPFINGSCSSAKL